MSSENNFSVVNNAEDVSGRKMSFHFGLNDDDNGGDLPIEDPKGKDVSAPGILSLYSPPVVHNHPFLPYFDEKIWRHLQFYYGFAKDWLRF